MKTSKHIKRISLILLISMIALALFKVSYGADTVSKGLTGAGYSIV